MDGAIHLASRHKKKPKQADLCRAVSSAYYALFHCLAYECANQLVGTAGTDRGSEEWARVYRSLDHSTAKKACRHIDAVRIFSQSVQDFAIAFAELQEKRHAADYDPFVRLTKSGTLAEILRARKVIEEFTIAPKRDRRAFCVFVMFRARI